MTFYPASPFLLVQAVIKKAIADIQTSKLRILANILICCNSSHTVRGSNQVLPFSCQSQRSPKLFITLYFIYDYIFPCHLKVRESQFAGRNRAAKAFHKDRSCFHLSHRLGKLWDVGFTFCRQALSFIYSRYHVESLNIVFYAKHLRCYRRRFGK